MAKPAKKPATVPVKPAPPQKTPVMIDGQEHLFEDLTPEQQELFRHVVNLDRQAQEAQFKLNQAQFARQAFMQRLTALMAATAGGK